MNVQMASKESRVLDKAGPSNNSVTADTAPCRAEDENLQRA